MVLFQYLQERLEPYILNLDFFHLRLYLPILATEAYSNGDLVYKLFTITILKHTPVGDWIRPLANQVRKSLSRQTRLSASLVVGGIVVARSWR